MTFGDQRLCLAIANTGRGHLSTNSLVKLRAQKRRLTRLVQRSSEARPVRHAQVVLQLACGDGVTQVSEALTVTRSTVYRWLEWFVALGEAWLTACDSGRSAYTVDDTLRETLLELNRARWVLNGEGSR